MVHFGQQIFLLKEWLHLDELDNIYLYRNTFLQRVLVSWHSSGKIQVKKVVKEPEIIN